MSAPAPTLYESGTTTPLAPWNLGPGTLGPLDEGMVKTFDLANVGAESEDITELSLGVLQSSDAGATFDADGELCQARWVQMRAVGATGDGIEAQTTAWTPVGLGARLILKPIPAECLRQIEAKVVIPAGFTSTALQVDFNVDWSRGYFALSHGFFESGIQGVIGGTGDPEYSALLSGGELTATGTPDGNVQIASYAAKVAGVPLVKYAQAKALSASASGKARWVTLSIAADNTVTATASAEVTAPAPVGDRPAAPAGEPLLGWIHRDDGTIATGDIYTDGVRRSPYMLATSGLNGTLGPGRSIIDNRMTWRDRDAPITFANNQTSIVYVQPDNSTEVVAEGTAPSWARALPLWAITMTSGVETARRDLRTVLGPRVYTFAAHFPGDAAEEAAIYYALPRDRGAYIKLPAGVELSAAAIGDHTTGVLRVLLEWLDGVTWTNLFSDTTHEPQLEPDADPPISGGWLPDTVYLAPGTRLRFRIDEVPTGGAVDPSEVFARVDLEEAPL